MMDEISCHVSLFQTVAKVSSLSENSNSGVNRETIDRKKGFPWEPTRNPSTRFGGGLGVFETLETVLN